MPAAYAQGCSEKLLIGAYGVSGGGTAIGVGPVVFVAVFNFSGDGQVDGVFYQKVNGNNVQVTFTGVYTVDDNCVASVTNNLSSGATATLTLVIVNGGKEFYLLNTTPPTATAASVVSAVGKRRRH
jgi:hypothetical protein